MRAAVRFLKTVVRIAPASTAEPWSCTHRPERSAGLFSKGQNQVYVSAATTWEASTKKSLGKPKAPDDHDGIIKDERFLELPISCYHSHLAGLLPPIHRDPFDRMLVAQVQAEGLTLLTGDLNIRKYSVRKMNAR